MKPAIPDVIDKFKTYYAKHGGWGLTLHVVMEDFNSEAGFVAEEYETEARERGDHEGAELISVLRSMSRTQRRKLARLAIDFGRSPPKTVSSLLECNSTPNSMYRAGSNVYLNR